MTPPQRLAITRLAELAKRKHYYCEDSWYSCPKDPEGCANSELPEDECDCGADKHNAEVDRAMSHFDDEWHHEKESILTRPQFCISCGEITKPGARGTETHCSQCGEQYANQ